jgi:hypothetical protein
MTPFQSPTLLLTELPRAIQSLTKDNAPGYRKLYNLTIDNRLPATLVNGRWRVQRSDVPAIVEAFGLTIAA